MFTIKSGNRSIIIVVFEIFSIIFGVLIALWLNNWRENTNEERRVTLAYDSIRNEIIENKGQLQRALGYHSKLQEDLSNLKTDEDIKQYQWTGYRPASIIDFSFETAKSTGVFSLMDYTVAGELSKVYMKQQRLEKTMDLYLQAIITNPEFTFKFDRSVIQLLTFSFYDITFLEKNLLTEYDAALAVLENVK